MAITQSDLQEKLDAIECALYEGVLEVQYSDKKVRYRSFDEMKKTIDLIKSQLGKSKKTCRIPAKFSKGTC